MPKWTFIWVLSNVDSTILDVEFGPGTSVEAHEVNEGIRLLAEIEGSGEHPIRKALSSTATLNVAERRIYFLRWCVEVCGPRDERLPDSRELEGEPHVSLDAVSNRLRLARLFYHGNIQAPLSYVYSEEEGKKHFHASSQTNLPVEKEPFSLEPEKRRELNRFINQVTLPFTQKYIDLGFRAFEASYSVVGTGVRLLTLWSGLEALLNPGNQELRYTLSRNVGVLLADDLTSYRRVAVEMKKLYTKRSKFVHLGDESRIDEQDVLTVRARLRECILRALELNLTKKQLTDMIDRSGFGRLREAQTS